MQQTANRLRRLAYAAGLAAKAADTEAVHDLRVAIRRLAQCLRAFAPFFPHRATRKIRRALKAMLALASAVRDRDIAVNLAARAKIAPGTELRTRLAEERGVAQKALVTDLKQWTRTNLSRKWRSSLMEDELSRDSSPSAASSARQSLPDLVVSYYQAGRTLLAADANPETLHEFRLLTKKVRYTLELYRSCYGPGLERILTSLARMQDHLGAISDCETTARTCGAAVAEDSPDLERLRTYLSRRAAREEAAFRRYWREEFDAAAEIQRWVTYLKRPTARASG
jgi:CHAD domain-containing protein